ncbi:hypothetical protein ACIF8T_31460 [Streptomyces sp. NPDC085946]|uniref:hypothetical protein n=1 Tax=Streptomyces sp. NPDC085946 TaxID=3365744 RepID=UPI0037D64544
MNSPYRDLPRRGPARYPDGTKVSALRPTCGSEVRPGIIDDTGGAAAPVPTTATATATTTVDTTG